MTKTSKTTNILAVTITANIIALFAVFMVFKVSHYIAAILLFTLTGQVIYSFHYFLQRIRKIGKLAKALAAEELENRKWKGDDVKIYENLSAVQYKIDEVIDFVRSNDSNYTFQHIDSSGEIGHVLLSLAQEKKKISEEEYRRNWKNEGLAKFGELLRTKDENLKDLSLIILSHLVKYLGANQGGFFIEYESEDKRYMELTAAYAYDRKKFIEATIEEGDGLLGQVMLEKDLIFLTDVPGDFVNITSGLGEATPRNIIIVPLITNDIFYGAIELASFDILEDYKLDFLKEVAENIASVVAGVKTNEHTQQLLEQSQKLARDLRLQEEGMRENMEELQNTQEEMRRKQVELKGVFSAINNSQGMVEVAPNGEWLSTNSRLEEILGYDEHELCANSKKIFPEISTSCWNNLDDGESTSMEISVLSKSGETKWLGISCSPIVDESGNFQKVLLLASDITSRKKEEQEFKRLSLVANSTNNSVIITDQTGLVEYVNEGFTKLTGYTQDEMKGKKPGDVLQGADTDIKTVKRISKKLAQNQPLYEEILNYNKEGESYWISLAINPVFSQNGEVEKYISIQTDITETKEKALNYHYQFEAISRSNAIVEFDTSSNILAANENFLRIFKYREEEVIGLKHNTFMFEEDYKSDEYEKFWEQLRNGEFIQREFRRKDRYGNEVWLKGVYNPIMNLHGEVTKIIKFVVDVTRERLLHFETEKQQEEIKSHLETIDKTIASLEFDILGKISYVNQVFLDVSGYDEDELIGKNYEYLLPPEEVDKPQTQMMWMSLRDGNYFTGQFKQKSKSGKSLWLSGTFNPIVNEEGEAERVMMFAQFNTKEVAQKEDLTQIVSALKRSAIVVEINNDGTFKNANEKFFKKFGYSRMDLRKKEITYLLDSSTSKRKLAMLLLKFNKTEFFEEVLTFVSKDGEKKTFKVSMSPIMNMDGEIDKVVAILTNEANVLNLSPN